MSVKKIEYWELEVNGGSTEIHLFTTVEFKSYNFY